MSTNGAESPTNDPPDPPEHLKSTPTVATPEVDEFGLPIRPVKRRTFDEEKDEDDVDDNSISRGHECKQHETPTTPSIITPSLEPVTQMVQNKTPYKTPDKNPPVAPIASVTSAEPSSSPLPHRPEPPAQDEAKQAVIASNSDSQPQRGASEWSHQQLPQKDPIQERAKHDEEMEWQEMPAFATHTIYDDWGKIVAREVAELEEEDYAAHGNLGGAAKGYTRVQLDDDVQSATSLDEDTAYLFKPDAGANTLDDDENRDVLSQMQATKHLLTEGQRIAYVGLVRLSMLQMTKALNSLKTTKGTKKQLEVAIEATQMWSQKMMVRLYSHMEIDAAEQVMIEQLAEHGVEPADLTAPLMQNARVKNPAAKETEASTSSTHVNDDKTGEPSSSPSLSIPNTPTAPPAYEEDNPPDYLTVKNPSELPDTKNIDIDLRWTVLCDLFLVLIADSIYDARSRTLLELVGSALSVPWLDICRFEKRVTDALEMQEAADKENWNEDEHTARRKKMARNRRLVMMGLATVGGGLVIGLSAGLMAPVIGAGLAAGFSTIGVAGTSSFLAGAGGAAIITSTGVLTGGTVAVRASNRRTGPVRTFEYRPLHNNKRCNLIVTVAGWMTGKVDDVRLPYSTVNPIMGDIYSVFWEPEMLQSMGDTINILATEALTQGLQQILGSTLLIALMSALQLPLVLTKLSYLIDNPWNVSMARADMAGLILADSLIDRNLGVRPVTLVGFSLGSRVIYSCLRELANRGAYGIVQNAYLFGSPCIATNDDYIRCKAVVSGRFVNGYATNDWILGYLFRATSGGISRVAGLAAVEVPGIENHDVTEFVQGHMAYRKAMPRLLREVGWVVESDEFSEIEDPDPENHEKRQRELINEIEEARKALEKKPEKKGFKALFSRNKKQAEKKDWETYDERFKNGPNGETNGSGLEGGTLFDIDAIQREVAELAAQGIEIKEIKSTLPPMKLDVDNAGGSSNPYSTLRQTKSFGGLADHPKNPSSPDGYSSMHQPSPKPYDYDEYEYDDPKVSKISMTFESPEKPRPTFEGRKLSGVSPVPSPTLSSFGGRSLASPTLSSFGGHSLASPTLSQFGGRPPLQSTSSMPVASITAGLAAEKNAWADDDDEFGKEKEMEMTFE